MYFYLKWLNLSFMLYLLSVKLEQVSINMKIYSAGVLPSLVEKTVIVIHGHFVVVHDHETFPS